MMEFNTVNLELYFKVFSFVFNNWGLEWWHAALGYKCKASWLQKGTVNKNKNSLRM